MLYVMPLGYPVELRWRVVWLYVAHNCSVSNIANKLCLSKWTVRRCIAMFQCTSDVQTITQSHGPVKLRGNFERLLLLQFIASSKGIYLCEINLNWNQSKLYDFIAAYIATMCRALQRMGCTRQVMHTLMYTIVINQELSLRQKYLCMILQC